MLEGKKKEVQINAKTIQKSYTFNSKKCFIEVLPNDYKRDVILSTIANVVIFFGFYNNLIYML